MFVRVVIGGKKNLGNDQYRIEKGTYNLQLAFFLLNKIYFNFSYIQSFQL